MVLFADVQGYSTLADQLVRAEGAQGVEKLARVLAATLGPLVDCYQHHGGEVVAFAGDAIVVLFCQDGGADVVQAAAEAALAGEAVLDGLRRRDPSLPLARQVLVAGELTLCAVGENPRFAVVSGAPMRRVARLLTNTPPGRTVLDGAARRRVTGRINSRGVLLEVPTTQSPSRVDAVRDALGRPASVGMTAHFVSPYLQNRLGQEDWYAELRAVTVLFVRLPDEQPMLAGRLSAVVEKVQAILAAHLGVLAEVVDDDKGMVLVGAFGLPQPEVFRPVAPVLAALEIARTLEPFTPGIGVASGRVYFGEIGGHERRGLCLLGSVTNLAARLMTQGVGVYCDEDNARATRDLVSFAQPRAVPLKGFSEPVVVWQALQERDQTVRVVGRLDERVRLRSDEAGLILLTGEPGAGRSALVEELPHALRVDDSVQLRDVPGGVLSRLLPEQAEARAGEMAPLLAPLLGREIPDTEATALLTGPVRAACLVELLVELCGGDGRLVVDDAQWLDDVSFEVVTRLAEQRPVVMSCRCRSGALPASFRRLPDEVRLHLEPLSLDDLSQLVQQRLGLAESPPEALLQWVLGRSQGLPGLAVELVQLVVDREVVTLSAGTVRFFDPTGLDGLDAPATIEAALAAALDRLPAGTREALEVASSIGVRVDVELWRAACAALSVSPSLSGAGHLVERTDAGWAFKSATTRKVLHDGLLHQRRQELHLAVARVLTERDAPPAELAFHWGLAGHTEQALPLLDQAWQQAHRQGLSRAAFRQANRAQRWLPEDADPRERAEWHYRAAVSCRGFGGTEEANTALLEAVSLLQLEVPDSVGGFRWQLGSLGLRHLMDNVRGARAGSSTPLEARVMSLLSLARFLRNEPPEAQLATALHAVHLARRSPEPVPAAMACSMVAVALTRFPSVADRYLDEGRGLAEMLGEPTEWVDWAIGQMLVDFAHLRFDEAQAAMSRVESVSQRLRTDALRAALLSIVSCVDLVTGEARRCWSRTHEVARIGERSGYLQARGWAGNVQASLWLAAGEPERALLSAQQSEPPLAQRGDVMALSSMALQAAAHLELGEGGDALACVDRLEVELAMSPPIPATGVECLAIPVMVLHRMGKPERARAALKRLQRFASNYPVAQPRVALLRAMVALDVDELTRLARHAEAQGLWFEEYWALTLLGESAGRMEQVHARFRP